MTQRHLMTALFLLLPALASALPEVAWRLDLKGPALSHPAVSTSGLIAVSTQGAVWVVDAKGAVLRKISGTTSGQPMWDADALWVPTPQGWTRHAGDEVSKPCAPAAATPTLTADGRLLWAGARTLETCDSVIASRKGREGQVIVVRDGFVTVDAWWLEFFDTSFKQLAQVRVEQVGSPAGVDAQGRLLVTAPNGTLRAVDATGTVVWQGPAGDDGPPLVAPTGLLVSGGRTLSLIDGEHTRWSLSIAAGARQAAVLEEGQIAFLERTGRLGLVQNGRPIWATRLTEPGQLFGVHPEGLVFVQEGTRLVAWRFPRPDPASLVPVFQGFDRSGRIPQNAPPVEPEIVTESTLPCFHGRCAIRNAGK